MSDLDIIERALLLGAPRYGHTDALKAVARLKAKATKRLTMEDVRLHCGELTEREQVAVRWAFFLFFLPQMLKRRTSALLPITDECMASKPRTNFELKY